MTFLLLAGFGPPLTDRNVSTGITSRRVRPY